MQLLVELLVGGVGGFSGGEAPRCMPFPLIGKLKPIAPPLEYYPPGETRGFPVCPIRSVS